MSAYREAPAPAGLPFPRARLGLFTALVVVLSGMVIAGAVAVVSFGGGLSFFKEGGAGMLVLVALSVMCAAALGGLGVFAVRGKRRPAAVVTAIPVVPAIASGICFERGVHVGLGFASGESVDPAYVMRILAESIAEADSALVLGCAISAIACAAASAALLGSAASVVSGAREAPARSREELAPVVLGAIGIVVSITMRFTLRSPTGAAFVTLPFAILVTLLSSIAARRGATVREWNEAGETKAWIGAIAAGAVVAAAGIALADLAALYATERSGFSQLVTLEPHQRMAVLVHTALRARAAKIVTAVDGLLVLATVGSALLSVLGRGDHRRSSSRLMATPVVAVTAMAVALVAVVGARAVVMHEVALRSERAARAADEGVLPMADDPNVFEAGSEYGPTVRIAGEEGSRAPILDGHQRNIVVACHPKTKWEAVESVLHATIAGRLVETNERGSRPSSSASLRPPPPTISIRVLPRTKPDLTALGRYEMFLAGAPPRSILVSLEGSTLPLERSSKRVALEQTDDMQTVVDKLATAATEGGHGSPRLVVPARTGARW